MMKYYLAPLEGITTFIYRRTYHKYFHPMDKYFTPFLSPHTKRDFNYKEKNDILPEHNSGMYVVPQILSNQADGFIQTARKLKAYGYEEVNLNLGCPSKTVVSRGRGSGFLAHEKELEEFLDAIFSGLDMKISVKTRIGKDSPEEFERLLEIYNRFPMEELIIHPRIQKDFYKNHPNMETYAYAYKNSKNPLCYNGDLFTAGSIRAVRDAFPETDCVMLGRGILRDPGLVQRYADGTGAGKDVVRAFHDDLLMQYVEEMSGDRNVLFKMKELWSYLIYSFAGGEAYGKKIRKCAELKHYERIVNELFENCSFGSSGF